MQIKTHETNKLRRPEKTFYLIMSNISLNKI